MDFSASTWRVLGLSVAATYIGLGTFAISAPVTAAQRFGLYPQNNSGVSSEKLLTTDKEEHGKAIATSMTLLGARDLSIGIALACLDYQEHPRAMGTLILSGMVLCVADVYQIWRLRGPGWGSAFAAGASIWLVIGVKMVQ